MAVNIFCIYIMHIKKTVLYSYLCRTHINSHIKFKSFFSGHAHALATGLLRLRAKVFCRILKSEKNVRPLPGIYSQQGREREGVREVYVYIGKVKEREREARQRT